MGELTASQFLGFMSMWTIAVAVLVDVVWCRPHRDRARGTDAENRRLARRLERVEQRSAIHHHRALTPAELEHLEQQWLRRRGEPPTALPADPELRPLRLVEEEGA